MVEGLSAHEGNAMRACGTGGLSAYVATGYDGGSGLHNAYYVPSQADRLG